MIEIYTTTHCGPCKTLKVWLKEKDIDFKERDLSDYIVEAMLAGVRSAPTMVKDGKVTSGANNIMKELGQ